MKNKSLLLLTSLIFTSLLTANAFSQNTQPADQGISVHNYKHANKAAIAWKNKPGGMLIPENNPVSVSNSSTYRKNGNQDYTPKYKTRTYAFVIYTKQKKEKSGINPLTSGRHYKTGNDTNLKSTTTDSLSASI